MKKYLVPLTITSLIMALILAACGAKAAAVGTSSSGQASNGTPQARNLTQPLPMAEQLVVGTFKLEGTSNAITSTQAAALVPLWQAYSQLTTSNTAAQAEIDAVITQIQQTMTPQQVQAITAMKLTQQDMVKTMSDLGLSNFQGGANGTPGFSFTPRAGGGGFAGGGGGSAGGDGGPTFFVGGGGAGAGGTGGTQPTANPTQQALRAQFANRIPTALMNALIELLQKKV